MTRLIKGRGAQYNPVNQFLQNHIDWDEQVGCEEENKPRTEYFNEHPLSIVSKNDSPDLKMMYSINPYQGCEHGCVYCYARPTHEYWGFSAGLDFESKIIVKKNAPQLLVNELMNPNWKVSPIMLSGNTDCYQPAERKFGLTRAILDIMEQFQHPVAIITKNSLIERDLDVLKRLAENRLVHVYFSVTTLDEDLRRKMEPRTATFHQKLKLIERLAQEKIPVGVMAAPIIPGLNHHEIPSILQATANAGAMSAGYTVVRLNGKIGEIFENWLSGTFPDRLQKVVNQVSGLHDGKLSDSEWGRRLVGSGKISESIKRLFEVSMARYFGKMEVPKLNCESFRRRGNYSLF